MSRDEEKKEGRMPGLEELEGYQYSIGHPAQKEQFMRTTRALEDFLGRNVDKALRMLVKKGEEATFPAPDRPGEDATQADWELYRVELKLHADDKKRYERNKAKLFQIIMGMCSIALRSKLEGLLAEFQALEDSDNVVGLLAKIKEMVYTTDKTQYEYWDMQKQVRVLHTMKQEQRESVEDFGRRFLEQAEVTEGRWGGKLIPRTVHGQSTAVQEKAHQKYLACVFLAGVDRTTHLPVINELNNDFVAGRVNYPEDVAGMINLLTNRRGKGDGKAKREEAIKDGIAMEFVQWKPIECWNCGGPHMARNCKSPPKDGDAVSVMSNKSNKSFVSQKGKTKWTGKKKKAFQAFMEKNKGGGSESGGGSVASGRRSPHWAL